MALASRLAQRRNSRKTSQVSRARLRSNLLHLLDHAGLPRLACRNAWTALRATCVRVARRLPFHVMPDTAHPARDQHTARAEYAVRLAMSRLWVNRRVETFTFLDANTVRRRMSVDLTLRPGSGLQLGEIALIPLMLLVKHDLRNLDVRGPSDEPLPVLNTQQNGEVAILGLTAVLQGFVSGLPSHHPDKTVDEEVLEEIVHAELGHSAEAAAHVAPGGALDRQLRHAEPDIRSPVQRLILQLESSFMLLVPLQFAPDERLICKLSYDAAIRPLAASGVARVYRRANRIWSTLGLAGRLEVFDNLPVGLGQSYHAEAVPPRDAYVAEAALSVRRAGAALDEEPMTDDHDFRPHLRARAHARGDRGKLSLILQAHRQELLLPLAFSSGLISLVLAFLPEHVYHLDGQTFAALLLVPFALSAYYIRGQENSYVTHMLQGARGLAAVPLGAAIYALTLGALGVIPPASGSRLSARTLVEIRVPFVVAVLPTLVLGLAVAAPTIGAWTRPPRRTLQRLSGDSPNGRLALGVAAIILASAVVGFAGYGIDRGLSMWWKASVPSTPTSSVLSK
jgi:hypothetical protein